MRNGNGTARHGAPSLKLRRFRPSAWPALCQSFLCAARHERNKKKFQPPFHSEARRPFRGYSHSSCRSDSPSAAAHPHFNLHRQPRRSPTRDERTTWRSAQRSSRGHWALSSASCCCCCSPSPSPSAHRFSLAPHCPLRRGRLQPHHHPRPLCSLRCWRRGRDLDPTQTQTQPAIVMRRSGRHPWRRSIISRSRRRLLLPRPSSPTLPARWWRTAMPPRLRAAAHRQTCASTRTSACDPSSSTGRRPQQQQTPRNTGMVATHTHLPCAHSDPLSLACAHVPFRAGHSPNLASSSLALLV